MRGAAREMRRVIAALGLGDVELQLCRQRVRDDVARPMRDARRFGIEEQESAAHCGQASRAVGRLGLRAYRVHDLAGLRVPAEGLLGEDEIAVDRDFEDAAGRRDDDEGGHGVLHFVQDLSRQTDGSVAISSLGAVFDADLHRALRIAGDS